MKPIIITTPRTGSTLLCEMLTASLGLKNNLNEFFFTTHRGYNSYYVEDDIIQVTDGFLTDECMWANSASDIHAERLGLFKTHEPTDYMIKLHSYDLLSPGVVEFIRNYDTTIFLERRSISDQILSYCAMMQDFKTGDKFHHTPESAPIKSIHFDPLFGKEILIMMKLYDRFKRRYKGNSVTIIYEDFIKNPDEYLSKLLNIDAKSDHSFNTIKTKYASSNLEELVDNKDEWQLYKETIIEPYERSRDGSTRLR